jgi:hypothetical protein
LEGGLGTVIALVPGNSNRTPGAVQKKLPRRRSEHVLKVDGRGCFRDNTTLPRARIDLDLMLALPTHVRP